MSLYGAIDKVTGKVALDDNGRPIITATRQESDDILETKRARELIREYFPKIKEVFRNYVETSEENLEIIALWIIGTYLHKEFQAFPYLFLNAMRGSAKTRTLKLILALSKDSQLLTSITEAVLFRTTGTLGLDEFEGVGSKEKQPLRELLNSSYKKGGTVIRMRKTKSIDGETQTPEAFEPYRPIVMSNIWGMDEVLGDRCINIILEKSNNPVVTKKIEDFETNEKIIEIKRAFVTTINDNKCSLCNLCSLVSKKGIQSEWNNYINNKYSYTPNYTTTLTTLTTLTTPEEECSDQKKTTSTKFELLEQAKLDKIFNKIDDSKIEGRSLELFMPLFLIGNMIDEKVLDNIINISKKMVETKKHDQETESKDVMLYDFISRKQSSLEYYSIKTLTLQFRQFVECEDLEDRWLNARWMGRALKRLNLITHKRRVANGVEAVLNVNKAMEKLKMFKAKGDVEDEGN